MLFNIRNAIKNLIASILYFSGVLFVLKSVKLRNKVVVLMYHRVLPSDEENSSFSASSIIVRPEIFDAHLRYISSTFNVLTLESFIKQLTEHKSFSGYNCLLTFDDGWLDNYQHAFPLLKKHNCSATIFLPTNYIGFNNTFWQEKLSCLIYQLLKSGAHIEQLNKYGLDGIYSDNDLNLRKNIKQYSLRLRKKDIRDIKRMITEIKQLLKVDDNHCATFTNDKYLTWNEINDMSNIVSFGSHATSHDKLTELPIDQVKNELTESKKIIESHLSIKVNSIAYPNGNVDSNIVEIANQSNYKVGFTTRPGYVAANDNPYTLKRINIHTASTQTVPRLMCKILGLF